MEGRWPPCAKNAPHVLTLVKAVKLSFASKIITNFSVDNGGWTLIQQHVAVLEFSAVFWGRFYLHRISILDKRSALVDVGETLHILSIELYA